MRTASRLLILIVLATCSYVDVPIARGVVRTSSNAATNTPEYSKTVDQSAALALTQGPVTSKKSSNSGKKGRVVHGVYTKDDLTFRIPQHWKVVQGSQVSSSVVDMARADIVFNIQGTECFVALGVPALVETEFGDTVQIGKHPYAVYEAFSQLGPPWEETWPFTVVREVRSPSTKNPQLFTLSIDSKGGTNFQDYLGKCRYQFTTVLSANVVTAPYAPPLLKEYTGSTLKIFNQAGQDKAVYLYTQKRNRKYMTPIAIPSRNFESVEHAGPIIHSDTLYYVDDDYYLAAYNFWTGKKFRVPLVSINLKTTRYAPTDHNVILDYTLVRNRILYLSEVACAGGLRDFEECKTELREYDLRTRVDRHVAFVLAQTILGYDTSRHQLYLEGRPHGAGECRTPSNAVYTVELHTGVVSQYTRGSCTSEEQENEQKKRANLEYVFSTHTIRTNAFRINARALTPLPRVQEFKSEGVIRYIP